MHRHHNGLKTAVLLGALSALILWVGSFFGRGGLLVALVVALLTNGIGYFYSDTIALRAMRARPVTEAEQPVMYRVVRELATLARQPFCPAFAFVPDNVWLLANAAGTAPDSKS